MDREDSPAYGSSEGTLKAMDGLRIINIGFGATQFYHGFSSGVRAERASEHRDLSSQSLEASLEAKEEDAVVVSFSEELKALVESKEQDSSGSQLSEEEKKQVEELQKRDREVRTHEQAHKAAAGQYALGGPTYDFQTGPDNRKYAVGGEVQIDTAEEGTPEQTIRKMDKVQRAALAPAEPSSQDRAVAGKAAQTKAKAQAELAKDRSKDAKEIDQPQNETSIFSYSADRSLSHFEGSSGQSLNVSA